MKTHPQLKRIKIEGEKVNIDGKLQKNIDGRSCKILFPVDQSENNAAFEAIYIKDKNTVYYVQLKIYRSQSEPKTIVRKITNDTQHFLVIGKDGVLSKDSHFVYRFGNTLPNVDPSTFELIPSFNFAKDKNHVYYYTDYEPYFMTLINADPKTFTALQDMDGSYNGYGSDRDNLYYEWKLSNHQKWDWFNKSPIYQDGRMLVREFSTNEECITDFIVKNKAWKGYWWSNGYDKKPEEAKSLGKFHYAKSDTTVFTKNQTKDTPELIYGADPKTFKPINEQFSRDKKSVFYYGYKVLGVDPKTLEILSKNNSWYEHKYLSDSQSVYCVSTKYDEFYSFPIENADPATFKLIDSICTEDKNCTYKKGIPQNGGKSDSKPLIEILNDRFSRDRTYVYWDGSAIKKSNPKTFELLFDDDPQSWAKDSVNLYNANGHRIVKGVCGESFKMLDTVYGKDKKTVFCFENEKLVTSTDTSYFETIKETGLAKDSKSYFFIGKKISKSKYDELLEILTPLIADKQNLKKKRRQLYSKIYNIIILS